MFHGRIGICKVADPPELLLSSVQPLSVQLWGQQWGCAVQHSPAQHPHICQTPNIPKYITTVKLHCIVVAIWSYEETMYAALLILTDQARLIQWESRNCGYLSFSFFMQVWADKASESIKAGKAFFFYIKAHTMQVSNMQFAMFDGNSLDERGALCSLLLCCKTWFCSCSRSKCKTSSEQ